MNIRKEIEELVFNKYGLKVNDPFSVAKQGLKFIEELDELYEAWEEWNVEKIECETGDCLFVAETLMILFDLPSSGKYVGNFSDVNTRINAISKGLNKCDSDIMRNIFTLIDDMYDSYHNDYASNCKSKGDLLQQTILKNQGRSGKIINGCYVKSEDI